uniref:Uncharacterized protein n=1 Tax=viral metagenome TaxID=1070528 RepID=A0A6C0CBG3_9ZZZZ
MSKISHEKSLASFFEEVLLNERSIALSWSNKNVVGVGDISKWSKENYLFNCNKCKHSVVRSPYSLMKNQTCPYCNGRKLCDNDLCESCAKKSFLSSSKIKCWSSQNTVSARNVSIRSGIKYIFNCDKCSHSFETSPDNIAHGWWCPFCANKKLCADESCEICKLKSFACHPMSEHWSSKNLLNPRQILKYTHEKYIFNCDKCGHSPIISIICVTLQNHFCPYCANQSLCDDLKCETCIEKTFIMHDKSKYWSDENDKLPSQVFKNSNIKYKFDCPNCNQIYIAAPYHVSNGKWCKCTINKTETKLKQFLKQKFTYDVRTQPTFSWCKNIKYLPFDFLIEKFKLFIEIDGRQHFVQVKNWGNPVETQKRDIYKMKQANFHGYSVIRIFQEDVWGNKNNWEMNLLDCIKKYDIPVNIYIGNKYTYPYTKIGSIYKQREDLADESVLCAIEFIDDIINNEYYRTIFDNNKIDHSQTQQFQKMLLKNPYFLKTLISFIRHMFKKGSWKK